nr:ImmA/IrrE family metallo-endopeptidase [Janibacter hoylei]
MHVDEDVFAAGHRESEQRANAFAAALLMPEAYLREVVVDSLDDVAFANLVLDLKVSPSALAIRLKRLRLVDGMTQTALQSMTMREAQALADRGAEASAASQLAMQDRPPPTLGRDLYEAYLDGDTTLRPYASLLGTDTESLRASLESAGS